MKQIQKTLMEISMDLKNAPLLVRAQRNLGEASRPGDPSAFFRPERDDLYYPPSLHRDPDVWEPPPPIESKSKNTRISTANRKSEVNRKNIAVKSASGTATPHASRKLGGKLTNGKGPVSSARASSSNYKNGGKEQNGDTKGEKSDKDKDDESTEEQQNEQPEKKFEPASHADVDLVDMLGKSNFCYILLFLFI